MTSIREQQLGKKYNNVWDSDTDYLLSDGIETKLLSLGMRLSDMRVVPKDYGQLLVVRVGKSSEGKLIAFYGGKAVSECLRRCWDDITGDCAKFKQDEWAMRKLDESD